MKSLNDVRVIDASQVLAGPFAAMLLGDLGADVIKVEPVNGEATRRSFGTKAAWGETPGFLAVNRNKRSIALDLKSDRGRDIFHQLAAKCDVVIQNYRPGVAERLGISYPDLKPLNERLVFCSISGYGSTGRYAQRSGYDIMAQAMSGIMSVTGEEGGAPSRCGVPVADLGTAMLAATAILGALMNREATGKGCLVEASLLDSALAYAVWESTQYWTHGEVPRAHGSAHHLNAPYQAFRCADGYVTIGANNEDLWGRLCDALEHPEWRDDPRFTVAAQRVAHREALAAEIERAIGGRDRSEVEAVLERAGVPAAAVRNFDEVFDEQESTGDGMVDHAAYYGQQVRYLGSPIKLDGTRIPSRKRPPQFGEHTKEVLGWLGMSAAEIDDLRAQGVVRADRQTSNQG